MFVTALFMSHKNKLHFTAVFTLAALCLSFDFVIYAFMFVFAWTCMKVQFALTSGFVVTFLSELLEDLKLLQ